MTPYLQDEEAAASRIFSNAAGEFGSLVRLGLWGARRRFRVWGLGIIGFGLNGLGFRD